MHKMLIIILTLITISACKKDATKVYPELVGHWSPFNVTCIDPMTSSSYLRVEHNGKGVYSSGGYSDETFEGKVKVRKNKLFVKGEYIGKILYVNDKVEYIHHDTTIAPGLCTVDSVQVKGSLKMWIAETKTDRMYYRY